MAGQKGKSVPLGYIAKGSERYIESTAAHAPSVFLVSAGARPFDVYQGWRVGPSVVSLRPDLCRRHLEAATWRLPERPAACDHSQTISDTTTPSTAPPPHHHHRTSQQPSLRRTTVRPPARHFAAPPGHAALAPVRAPRFHVLTSKVRQAADSLRSSTLFYQTPPTISITPLR